MLGHSSFLPYQITFYSQSSVYSAFHVRAFKQLAYKIHTCVKKVPSNSTKIMRKKIRKDFFQFLHVDFVLF